MRNERPPRNPRSRSRNASPPPPHRSYRNFRNASDPDPQPVVLEAEKGWYDCEVIEDFTDTFYATEE